MKLRDMMCSSQPHCWGSVTTKKYPDVPDTRLHEIVMEVLEKFEGRGDAEA